MKQLLTFCLLLAFSIIGFAQPKATATDTKPAATVKAPKILTPEQAARLQQAQGEREKAQLREALAKTERERLEAQILIMIREFALELKLDLADYEIDLSQIAQGVLGFKPKPSPAPNEPGKKPETKP